MIDEELLEILCCPETRQSLALAAPEVLERVNAAIAAGRQRKVGGETVAEPIEAGLVRADGKVLYPIREGIPELLIEEGLPLE
jgi:uncharacterized protein YbaR (Trm112 family)